MALQIICESQSESQETVSVLEVYDAMRSSTIKQFLGDFQPRLGKTAEKERKHVLKCLDRGFDQKDGYGKRTTLPATEGPHASRQWVTVLRDLTAHGNLLN